MDAGVLQLHVFPHQVADNLQMVLGNHETIKPTITAHTQVQKTEPISLIVPTFFNRSLKNGSLSYLLDGVEDSSAIKEVILVCSSDDNGQVGDVAPLVGNRRLVRVACEPNKRARSRNIGVEAASCDNLLFLDDDMLLRDWKLADVILSEMLVGDYDCALFPRRNYARFPLLYDRTGLLSAIAQWRQRGGREGQPSLFDPVTQGCRYFTMTFCFPGCFMLIRRAAFERLEGFADNFEGWGFEDTDFAMKAVRRLRVLNLFRKADPLLHIDHPVSPYKSEEYQQNLEKFFGAHHTMDVDWLCRRIIEGDDFDGRAPTTIEDRKYLEPLDQIVEAYQLPVATDAVIKNYRHVLEQRVKQGVSPIPDHIVLHGSRGGGAARISSDFDLLFLFRGGPTEFFVSRRPDAAPVELEFTTYARFENIATRPSFHPIFGPLELAKLARAMHLWGDSDAWQQWVGALLRVALAHGRLYWYLQAMGAKLQPDTHNGFCDSYLAALRSMLRATDTELYRPDLEQLDNFDLLQFARHVRDSLDSTIPGWRADVSAGIKVFVFQVPEVWAALQWLMENERPTSYRSSNRN